MKTDNLLKIGCVISELQTLALKMGSNNEARTLIIEAEWKLQDACESIRKSMGPFAPVAIAKSEGK